MKRITYLFIYLFIVSCSDNIINENQNSFDDALIDLEKEIDKYEFTDISFNYDDVITVENSFDQQNPQKYLDALLLIKDVINPINNLKSSTEIDSSLVRQIVVSQDIDIENVFLFSEKELKILNSYFGRIDIENNAIQLTKLYEDFIGETILEEFSKNKLYEVFGTIKLMAFYLKAEKGLYYGDNVNVLKDSSVSCGPYRDCLDRCLCQKYKEYNTVDWIQFAVNPPADLLWNAASCAWSCL